MSKLWSIFHVLHLIQRDLLNKLNKFLKFIIFFPKPQVFNSRVIDQNLALGYCTVLPKEEMFNKLWEIISNSWQNYRKVLVNSQGLEFVQQTENVKEIPHLGPWERSWFCITG